MLSWKPKKLNYVDKIKKSLNKNKTIWDIVKLEANKTRSTEKVNTLNIDGNLISNHQAIVNVFNKYFLSIAKNINTIQSEHSSHNSDTTTPFHYLLQSLKNPFTNINLQSLLTKEVENIIKSLKPKNSSVYDGISTKLLKISSSFVSSPLTYICNKSLSSGIFPDRLKYGLVKPLFKKGDKSNISNYWQVPFQTYLKKLRIINFRNTWINTVF